MKRAKTTKYYEALARRYPLKVGDVVEPRPGFMTGGSRGSVITKIGQIGTEPASIPGGNWIYLDGRGDCWPRYKYRKIKQ